MGNKSVKYRCIKFPTGVIAYLDKEDNLRGTPQEVIDSLSVRENPAELNSFEVFLKNYLNPDNS